MWWSYHREWFRVWWDAVKVGKARDLILSLLGSGIGVIYGYFRGWITKERFLEFLLVAVMGYVALLLLTWLWHGLFTASQIYKQVGQSKTDSDQLAQKWAAEYQRCVEQKQSEFIAAKRELHEAHKETLKLRQELMSAGQSLIDAKSKAEANSQAFHEQFAETNRLQRELAKYQDTSVADSDPQIYAEFRDDRGFTSNRESEAYIELVNRGGSHALNVCIDSIRLKTHVISFPLLAYLIAPGRATHRYPDVTTIDDRAPHHVDVFSHICSEFLSLEDWLSMPELVLPLTVTYQDAARNLYEARCELVFDPAAHERVRTQGQNGSIVVVSTRDHQFRKLAVSAGDSEDKLNRP